MGNLKDLYKKNKKYLAEEIDLSYLVDQQLLATHLKQRTERQDKFHPSIISKGIPCERWWYFMLTGEEGVVDKETFPVKTLRAMLIGTAIHDGFQKALYEAGILEGMWKCRNCGAKFWGISPQSCPKCQTNLHWGKLGFLEVPFESEFVKGHADGIINIKNNRSLLELKSIKNDETKKSHYKYGFEHLTEPIDDHEMQAQVYLHEWKKKVTAAEAGYTVDIHENSYVIDTSVELDMAAAKAIGVINSACIFYIAKNSNETVNYVVARNELLVKYLYQSMAKTWVRVATKDRKDAMSSLIAKCTSENCQKSCQFGHLCKEC